MPASFWPMASMRVSCRRASASRQTRQEHPHHHHEWDPWLDPSEDDPSCVAHFITGSVTQNTTVLP